MDQELQAALRAGEYEKGARLQVRSGRPHEALELLGEPWSSGDQAAGEMFMEVLDGVPLPERLRYGSLLDRLAARGVQAAEEAWRKHFPAMTTILGRSRAAQHLRAFVYEQAQLDGPVLITGESGVGIGTAARAIHELSGRRGFGIVYAGAVALDLLREEIREEVPHEGTLLVAYTSSHDPPESWLGPTRECCEERNARLIVGGLGPLDTWPPWFLELMAGRFQIAPLRERFEDLPLLVAHFVERHVEPGVSATDETLSRLRTHFFGGNLRELTHMVERAVVLCGGNNSAFNERLTEVLPVPDADEPAPG